VDILDRGGLKKVGQNSEGFKLIFCTIWVVQQQNVRRTEEPDVSFGATGLLCQFF
jgi:hypothetical protein